MNPAVKWNKKAWLAIGAGLLIVIAAALGAYRSQQIIEQKRLSDELLVVQNRLEGLELDQLRLQQQQVNQQTADAQRLSVDITQRIGKETDSITASDTLFSIASASEVKITAISAGEQYVDKLAGVRVSVIAMSTTIEGEWDKLNSFISRLKTDYTTCYVDRVDMTYSDSTAGKPSSAVIKLLIYTYEGS